jgi:hypothetical protein
MDSEQNSAPTGASTTDRAISATMEFDPTVLTEDGALALLQRRDLAPEIIEQLGKNMGVMKAQKVRLAFAAHPYTPRRISLRLIRELYPGELVRFALLPAVAADLRHVASELLLTRLPSMTLGERISLARRAPATVAAALLLDKEPRVWQAVLENPRLTEANIVKALHRSGVTEALVASLCRHSKWSPRPEIRAALLLHEKTPLAQALAFASELPTAQVRDILHVSRLPVRVKTYLSKALFRSNRARKLLTDHP